MGPAWIVQWLRLGTSNAGGMGLISGQRAKGQKKKKKKKELRTTENQSLLHTYLGDKTYYLECGITEDRQTLLCVIVQSDFSEDK